MTDATSSDAPTADQGSQPTDGGSGFTVVDEAEHGRFTMQHDGETVGFANYQAHDGVVVIPHVETVARYRGRGYGARLMDGVLDILRADGRRVRPLCSFAAGHIRDNPQHHDLLG